MNDAQLLSLYQNSQQIKDLSEKIQEEAAYIKLTGARGSLGAFIMAATVKQMGGTHFFIAENKEEAAYLQNDLNAILDRQDVIFFPDSFRQAGKFDSLNRNQILQRTEGVNLLTHTTNRTSLLVTYPEAIFEKVVAPEVLKIHAVDIAVGEKLDVDFLTDVLVEYGFERVDFVYDPGQFSIRGGIVDIYSYGNEYPYRVELFDIEVESIRMFNPATQLSERNISRVTIVPNINTKFEKKDKCSVFSVLPPKSTIWVHDFGFMLDRVQECFDAAVAYADKVGAEAEILEDEIELKNKMEERAFLQTHEVLEGLAAFPICEWEPRGEPFRSFTAEFTFNSKPQPSFNKNFQFLIKDMAEHSARGFQSFLFADNARQIKRFESIFEDLKADFKWHAIPKAIHGGFIDEDQRLICYTDHQIFERFHKYKIRQGFDQSMALTLRRLKELQPGDFVTHMDHGIGRYSGLEKLNINGQIQEAVRLVYRDNDLLYVGINSLHKISRYVSKDGTPPKVHKLGSDTWANTKRRTKAKIKELAFDLIKLYAKRKSTKGIVYAPDDYLQTELEASFLYEDTPDQAKATEDVKRDMEKDYPMDRLVCGDVGFGKTEVAIRAAFKAVNNGKQVAILVPTTILALQHHKTFSQRMEDFKIKVEYINRFKSTKQKNEVIAKLATGEVEIVIGTHALISDKIKFKDLGLLIIDEEQKFGVSAKEKIRSVRFNVDTLTLTATPIPRTLQFSLMAARDLSIINTPPPNRQPIHTEVRTFNDAVLKESIEYEVSRGGQVFFIHNRVNQLEEIAAMLRRLCVDVDIAVAHGQMDSDKLEEVLVDFIDGKHEVLVSTNIIETGLDIPNANTIIINNAHHFGLSDLHQLRGRVGRSNRKAFCYLFCPPLSSLTDDARKRLRTIEEFSDLGSGFLIAMKDLDIRGAGNLLGAEQSGFIADIGYETYQKILGEAIRELKETDYHELFEEELSQRKEHIDDVNIETDIEMMIPDEYVENIQERLSLYTELDDIEGEELLLAFTEKLKDRFGKLPRQVNELLEGVRLKWVCKQLGFERVNLKNNKLRCYFVGNPQSRYYDSQTFKNIFAWIQKKSDHRLQLKQTPNSLMMVMDGVGSLSKAKKVCEEILGACG